MTRFVESFSTQQMLPPWFSKGANFWGFVIRVEDWCIQAYLDEFFNEEIGGPSPYYYTARDNIHFGLLVVADHADFASLHQPAAGQADQRGMKVQHREIYWSFPVKRYRRSPDNLIIGLPELVWTQPFGFEDNSYILFSSREIWGNEREMARIDLAQGETEEDLHIDVAVQGFKTFSPRTRASTIGVMHFLMSQNTGPDDPFPHIMEDPNLARFAGALLGAIPLARETDSPPPIRIDSVKQFRDVFDMDAATYRAIVTSTATQSNFSNIHFYSGETAKLAFLWSDSIGDAFKRLFGMTKPDTDGGSFAKSPAVVDEDGNGIDWDMPYTDVPVEFAVSFTADVLYEPGQTLFTYGDETV